MKRIACVILLLFAACAGQSFQEDMAAIRAILDLNNIVGVNIDSIAMTDSTGRVVALDLSNTDVTKDFVKVVPADIARLQALRKLSLASNSLTGVPEQIGNLTELRELDLGDNQLHSLDPAISNLVNLEKLDLRDNELNEFPEGILACKALWYLHLRGNNLVALPEGIGNLSALKELYLKGNRLSSLPRSIMKLNLPYLEVLENKLCDLPKDLDAWLKKKDKRYRDYQKCW